MTNPIHTNTRTRYITVWILLISTVMAAGVVLSGRSASVQQSKHTNILIGETMIIKQLI